MAKLNFDFLFDYLKTPSPAGYELDAQKVFLSYLNPLLRDVDSWDMDNFQNLIIKIGSKNPNAYNVLLEAHADEISWTVTHIDGNGYIHVAENGGVSPVTAVTKRVMIITRKGDAIPGIFGYLAPHLKSAEEKKSAPTVSSLYIDIGCTKSKEVAELGIKVGDPVVYKVSPFIMNKRFVVGRGLDNKIGGFVLAETARYFLTQKTDLPFNLWIANTSQEEVGKKGARVVARTINPDIVLVTDVGHDTSSPGAPIKKIGYASCGGGPIVASAPALHKLLAKHIRIRGNKEKIDYQLRAKGKETGTDADAFIEQGAITGLIQVPMRYMHSTCESVAISDIEATIKLFVATLEAFDENTINKFSYKKYLTSALAEEEKEEATEPTKEIVLPPPSEEESEERESTES